MHVDVDASSVGLGATLTQMQGGQEVMITCASHTLSKTERHYSAVEKEALGCLWAVERFEKYLLGHPFVLRILRKIPGLLKFTDKNDNVLSWTNQRIKQQLGTVLTN